MTPTDIANSALTRLGAEAILDIADPSKVNARTLARQYPIARDRLLADYRWQFAMKRDSLAADADAPKWGYDYRFLLPTDFLRIDQVGDSYAGYDASDYRDGDTADWAVESGYILTNLSAPLNIRYIRRVPDSEAASYAPHFADALGIRLALDCCEKITQATSKKESLRADLKEVMIAAVRVGAVQKPPQQLPDDTWVLGRL